MNGAHRKLYGYDKFPSSLIRSTREEVEVNWGVAAQSAELESIDVRQYWSGWSVADFRAAFNAKDMVTVVAGIRWGALGESFAKCVAGYAVVELFPGHLEVRRFAVDYPYQRLGVGSELLTKLKTLLKPGKREQLIVEVDEENVPAQLFLRKHNFYCIKVSPAPTGAFTRRPPTAGDVYTFLYTCRKEDQELAEASLRGELLL